MNRKPRKLVIFAAFALATGLAACAENGTGDSAKTKNSALEAKLVNAEFAPTGGGWTGDGFTLDSGCAANNPVAARPSLGTWTAASLTFGRSAATVRQEVVIPKPTAVTFAITGNLNANDPNGWFKVDLNDADEQKTTNRQTGAANIEPKAFTLSVTTTSPNEKVQIVLSGSGSNYWMGCYGPVLTKPLLTGLGIATPTTTSTTVAETTTTSSTTTSTTSTTTTTTTSTTTTTTTLPPTTTTTTAVPGCVISHVGTMLTFCKPATLVNFVFINAKGLAVGSFDSSGVNNANSVRVGAADAYPTATQIEATITFADKSVLRYVRIPVNGSISVADSAAPPPPTPKLLIGISWPTIRTNNFFSSYTYEWWDATKALTNPVRVQGSNGTELTMSGFTPVDGATRLVVTFRFTNGDSVKGVSIPFPPSTNWVWREYDLTKFPN